MPVKCLSVSQAGNLIAAGCNDGAVTLWSYWDNDEPTPSGHNTRRGKPRDGEVFRRQRPSADDRSPSLAQAPAAPWSPVAQAAAAEGAVNMAPFGAGIPDFGMADSGGGAAFGPSGVVGAGESAGATGMFPGSAAGATAGAGGSGAAGAASAGNGEGARRGGGGTRGRGRVGGRAEEEWDAGPLEVRRVLKLMGERRIGMYLYPSAMRVCTGFPRGRKFISCALFSLQYSGVYSGQRLRFFSVCCFRCVCVARK